MWGTIGKWAFNLLWLGLTGAVFYYFIFYYSEGSWFVTGTSTAWVKYIIYGVYFTVVGLIQAFVIVPLLNRWLGEGNDLSQPEAAASSMAAAAVAALYVVLAPQRKLA